MTTTCGTNLPDDCHTVHLHYPNGTVIPMSREAFDEAIEEANQWRERMGHPARQPGEIPINPRDITTVRPDQ